MALRFRDFTDAERVELECPRFDWLADARYVRRHTPLTDALIESQFESHYHAAKWFFDLLLLARVPR